MPHVAHPAGGERAVQQGRPRVLHVITCMAMGGSQLTLLALCEDLGARYDLHVAFGPDTGQEGSLEDRAREVVPTSPLPRLRRDIRPLDDLAALFALRRMFAATRPDIVHSHSSKAGILVRLAARGRGPRVVHTVHGWGHTPADSAVRRRTLIGLERLAARSTDALVAVSADVREEGLSLGIGKRSQYRVIPEAVDFSPGNPDFEAARADARQRLGIEEDATVIGWVGRFTPQKDPETLVGALRHLLGQGDDRRLAVLVGDGPLRLHAQESVVSAGIAERVRFTGLRPDARRLYPAFDLLLHPSRWEGQPRVVQEAIAERVPVVCTQVQGAGDLVPEGQVGFSVPPGDAVALAQRAERVLGDHTLRAPLPEAAVRVVASRNGRAISVSGHIELYDELLA